MDKEKIKQLQDQIWTTRISRVNAEKRMVNKNGFIQGINVYYSCVTIVRNRIVINTSADVP